MTTPPLPDKDEMFEPEYKLQNHLRITLQVESFTTEVYTGKRWVEVADYVEAILANYIPKSHLEPLLEEEPVIDINEIRRQLERGDITMSKFLELVWSAAQNALKQSIKGKLGL